MARLPEHSTGEIDGSPAILFAPFLKQENRLLDWQSCAVILDRHGDRQFQQLRFNCEEWFQPPLGKYDAWLEVDDFTSESPSSFVYGGGPFRGYGTRILMPVAPAGVVRLSVHPSKRAESFRVLSLSANDPIYERRFSIEQAADGVLVKSGPAILGLFDAQDEAVMLTRPLVVEPSGVTEVSEFESTGAVLLIAPKRDSMGSKDGALYPALTSAKGRGLAPDVHFLSSDMVYAFWYDVNDATEQIVGSTGEIACTRIKTRRLWTCRPEKSAKRGEADE